MKTLATLLVLALCAPAALAEPVTTLAEARKRLPHLSHLDDESFINVVRDVYYPTMDKAELSKRLGYTPPPQKPKLGPIDKWRFEACQRDAAKAPTSQGVFIGMRLCREKFDQ